MNRLDRFAHNFNIFAAYLLLALIATWPLASQFSTHLAGADYLGVWNLWWVKHSVIDLRINPLYTDYIFYPYNVQLLMNDQCLLNGLLSIPLQLAMPLGQAYNLTVILSYPLGAFGMYLLARHLTGDWRAAFVAGAAFGFFPFKTIHAGLGIGMVHWIPFAMLYIIRMFESADQRESDSLSASGNAALAALFTGFAFMTEYHSLLFLGIFFVMLALYSAVVRRSAVLRSSFYFLILCAMLTAPVLFFAIREYRAGAIRSEWLLGPGAALSGLLSPLGLLSGWLSFVPANQIYLGLATIALSAMAVWLHWRSERFIRFIVICVIAFIALLPATRASIAMIMPLLSGLTAYWLRGRDWRICAAALAIILLEFLPMPFATVSAEIPEAYRTISTDRDAVTVLEVPFSVRDSDHATGLSTDSRILYYQTAHAKRMPNGFVRHLASERIFLSFYNLPILRSLPFIEKDKRAKLSVIESDKTIGPEMVNLLGLDYVILHRWYDSMDDMGAASYVSIREYLAYILHLKTVYEDDNITVFKTTRHEFNPLIIDLGNENAIPYLMTNWINAQASLSTDFGWVAGKSAQMLVGLKKGESYTASFFMRPQKLIKSPSITLYLNDTIIGRAKLDSEWTEYSYALPARAIKDGANRIAFVPDETILVPGDFRGPWTDASYFKFLKTRYIYDPAEALRPMDWEQDNSRFEGIPISIAVDAVRITRKTSDN